MEEGTLQVASESKKRMGPSLYLVMGAIWGQFGFREEVAPEPRSPMVDILKVSLTMPGITTTVMCRLCLGIEIILCPQRCY